MKKSPITEYIVIEILRASHKNIHGLTYMCQTKLLLCPQFERMV